MSGTFGIDARAYRWYEDGTEAGASAAAAENTGLTEAFASNRNLVLRYGVEETGSGNASGATTDDYQLQYSTNGGSSWNNVTTTSTHVQAYNSTNLTDAGATTRRLSVGGGSFVAGKICEDGLLDDWQLTANNHSELLYTVRVIAAAVSDGTVITFRVLRGTPSFAVFNSYNVTPTLTVQRIVSGTGTSDGVATVSGTLKGYGSLSGSAAGSATVAGAMEAGGGGPPATPVSLGNATSLVDPGGTTNINKPSGVVNGTVLVLCVGHNESAFTPPTGFTKQGNTAQFNVGFNWEQEVFTKLVTDAGSEPSSYSMSGGGYRDAWLIALHDADPSAIMPASGGVTNNSANSGTSATGLSCTVDRTGSLLLRFEASGSGNARTSGPSGMSAASVSSPIDSSFYADYQDELSAGSTGNKTSTLPASDGWAVHMIVIQPLEGAAEGAINGSSSGSATVTGTLKGTGDRTGTSNGAATVNGSVVGDCHLHGMSEGVATVSGSLNGEGGLSGTSDGVSTISGSIIGDGRLVGTSDGVATVDGSIVGDGRMTGASSGVATVTGTLFQEEIGPISGSVQGQATVSGSLIGDCHLSGTSDGVASVNGSIKATGSLVGSISGVATASGSVVGDGQLTASSSGVATVNGSLVGDGRLSGTSDSVATVSGSLFIEPPEDIPIVRYTITEDFSGQGPTVILDRRPNPVNLSIVYSGSTPTFTSITEGRGLDFPVGDVLNAGAFSEPLGPGNKVYDAINGAQRASIEVVAYIPQELIDGDFPNPVNIFGIFAEDGEYDAIGLWWWNQSIQIDITGQAGYPTAYYFSSFDASGLTAGLHVFHFIVDTPAVDPEDRLILKIDDNLATPFDSDFPDQNDSILISLTPQPPSNLDPPNPRVSLGNYYNFDFAPGNGGFFGAIFYAALYDVALDATQISDHVTLLSSDNDLIGDLTGSSSSVTTTNGNLEGLGHLVGSSSGQATVSGSVVADGRMTGSVSGSATVSGTLKGSGRVSGSSDGVATVTGNLFQEEVGPITGSSSGVASISGDLVGDGNLTGISDGIGAVSGTLKGSGALSATISGSATTNGSIVGGGRLIGSCVAASTVNGSLVAYGSLEGLIACSSTVSGVLENLLEPRIASIDEFIYKLTGGS